MEKLEKKHLNSRKVKIGNLEKLEKIVNGKNICFLTYGPIISQVFKLREKLRDKNLSSSIYSCHTIKPFDRSRVSKIFKKYNKIVVIEDNSTNSWAWIFN